jgi:hypothetical protein
MMRTIAIPIGNGILEVVQAPVISKGKAFDVVRRPDGKLWPVINQPDK